MARYGWWPLLIAAAIMVPGAASADVVFSDGTFSLANYNQTTVFSTNGASATVAQCPSCGNPGTALQITQTIPTGTGIFSQGYINTTFSYDPATQGDVSSISVSIDKNLTINFAETGIGNNFRFLIEQDGNFYFDSLLGPSFSTGAGGGSSGYNTISASGLLATNFQEYNFTTNTVSSGTPNFSGDTMLFGLAAFTSLNSQPSGSMVVPDFDNFTIDIAVPEPSTLTVLAASLSLLLGIRMATRKQG